MGQSPEATDAFARLLVRQEEIEGSCVAEGIQRFRARVVHAQQSGRGSQVGAAKKLLQSAIDPLARAFEELLEEGKTRPGRRHYVERWIKLVGPEPLAYLTVKTTLDVTTRNGVVLRLLASRLTGHLRDELRYRRFQEEAPGLFDYKMRKFNTSNYAHMARSLDATMRFADVNCDDLDMPKQQRLIVGIKLIDMLMQATGLITITDLQKNFSKNSRRKIRREKMVELTPETLEWMDARNGGLEGLWPVFMPMVVPPVSWTPERRGGYRFALRGKIPLVRGISQAHVPTVRKAKMPVVYEALNLIQETAWKINPSVLALVEEVMQSGKALAGIPALENEALPDKPQDIATNPDARKAWRRAAHQVKERNHVRKLKALEFQKTYATAAAVKDETHIYFPANLDFRGRVYPVCNYLNPQGDDLSKALLTFAAAKPLGENGATWLALHGANCLGETSEGIKLSRLTLQERVDWIVGHTNDIERIARQPLDTADVWAAANVDEPLQFYAFCCEWAGYVAAHRQGNGDNYLCHLPCAMDGTCNGLQHFAALLLDPIGGQAVNLVPSERPQDIYQKIADVILHVLEHDAVDEPLARLWLLSGLVGRKLTKRPTMTFGYGSKRFGFQQQLVDFVKGHERWNELRPLFSDGERQMAFLHPACSYMSRLIWEALQRTVVAASQGMEWMQGAARCVARGKACPSWTVPATNFPVRQEYWQFTSRQIETVLAGKLYKPVLNTDTNIPDILKQSNGIAPNFVHSLDAAALMLTVQASAAEGVSSFGMVHDSYATHAADCETLARVTREQFIRLYAEQDVIAGLCEELLAQCTEENQKDFPMPPDKGTLDLSAVMRSPYFFS